MFATYMAVEDGDGFELATAPLWPRIAVAIQALDGADHTLVSLEGANKTHMAIGGGPAACAVFATTDNQSFHQLIDPTKGNDNVEVVIGQQTHQYPAYFLVGKDLAIRAAKAFAEMGVLDESLPWHSRESEEE